MTPTSPADDRPGLEVLLVEDSEAFRAEFVRILTASPAVGRIDTAASVESARARIGQGDYDVWVLDFQLPDGTALDLLEARDGHPGARERVVVATNHTDPAIRRACLEAGADLFIYKLDALVRLQTLLPSLRPAPGEDPP